MIDRAAQVAAGSQTVNFDQDLNELAEAIAESGRLLATEPNAALADSTARMKFLTFERELPPLLAKGDIKGMRTLVERLASDLEAAAALVPANAEHGQTDGLLVVRELTKLTRILIDFRALSLEFPTGVEAGAGSAEARADTGARRGEAGFHPHSPGNQPVPFRRLRGLQHGGQGGGGARSGAAEPVERAFWVQILGEG